MDGEGPMSESKNLRWVDEYKEGDSPAEQPDDALSGNEPAANDADGWQQYRRWISSAPAPKGRRVGIDPALFTWKGYRSWTEQVRRNWKDDADNDSD